MQTECSADLFGFAPVEGPSIGEIPGLGRMPSDHRPLATVRLITPHAGLLPVQQLGQHRAVGDIGRRGHHRVDQFGSAVAFFV